MKHLTCEEREILEILLEYKKQKKHSLIPKHVSIEKEGDDVIRVNGLTQEQWEAVCQQLEAVRNQFINDGILTILKRYEPSPGQLSIVFENSEKPLVADENGTEDWLFNP